MEVITPDIENIANDFYTVSRPKSRYAHWQEIDGKGQLFVTNGSRLFEIEPELLESFDIASQSGDEAVEALIKSLHLDQPDFINSTPLQSPDLTAISLAIAQKCNLGCTYCYADQGNFGGPSKNMTYEVAKKSIDLLMGNAKPGTNVNIAFLGGEPLVNRTVLYAITEYAAVEGQKKDLKVSYSITTNGSLVTEKDAMFFEKFGFAVTVSLDGIGEKHDIQRPFKNGKGSFDLIMSRISVLLAHQKKMQVSVRATVTPDNLNLRETLDYFLEIGFHSVGFSPLLNSPTGQHEMNEGTMKKMLAAMIDCGREFERRVSNRERYAFANMSNAMRELHKGTHRPYPCGAGAGYLGISADGDLAACHRFVGDENAMMGNVEDGIDRNLQNNWLAERHVHNQSPCTGCWARYLCSGGCHHEVISRGRPACDYIRGWLHYCLQAYARLSKKNTGLF